MKRVLDIDVFFDFLCPWCLIGKRHLATAIERLVTPQSQLDIRVHWRSRLLLPDIPLNGTPYEAFYLQRLGNAAAVAARRAQVEQAGRAAGIQFRFDRIAMLPNTIAAHRLAMHPDLTEAQRDAIITRIFSAHFVDGLAIGDVQTLAHLAGTVGLDAPRMHDYLSSNAGRAPLLQAQSSPAYRTVSSVPGFVLNGSVIVSGAQPADALCDAMYKAISVRDDRPTDTFARISHA